MFISGNYEDLYTREQRIRSSDSAFCPVCRKGVRLLSFPDAARCFKTDAADILSLASRGLLHRLHNRHAVIMICSDSLFECFESRQTRRLDTALIHDTVPG